MIGTRVTLPSPIETQHGVIPAGTVLVVVAVDRDGKIVNLATEGGWLVVSGVPVDRVTSPAS